MAESLGTRGRNNEDVASEDVAARLKNYRRIVVLTEGFSTPFLAKTAISLLRYRVSDIVAVMDSNELGKTAGELFGTGGAIPIVDSIEDLHADALFIGIAQPGGSLPPKWRQIVTDTLRKGIDIVSGLHDFLSEDKEFIAIAKENNCCLFDVRKNSQRQTAKCVTFRENCLRILTVGQDCSVGKMVVSLEVQRELASRGRDVAFVATGQTGIMICGEGVPIDCVVSDFVNGAAEGLVKRNDDHEILMIEGQGSISHPAFSAVTLGLLHGCAPDGLIYCYEVERKMVKGLDGVSLLPHRTLIDAYQLNASLRHPCRVIGIAMNSRNVSPEEAAVERDRMTKQFGLPVCDVYRDGAAVLADAVEELGKEIAQ